VGGGRGVHIRARLNGSDVDTSLYGADEERAVSMEVLHVMSRATSVVVYVST